MASERLTLNLDPAKSSANLLIVIEALSGGSEKVFCSYSEISKLIRRDYTFTNRGEPLAMARLLGLLERVGRGIHLSKLGYLVHEMRPGVQADMLHFLLYTAWQNSRDRSFAVSWAYRSLCNQVWNGTTMFHKGSERKRVVADLIYEAQSEFPDAQQISFSTKSILGFRKWLELLEPAVLCDGTFNRRDICSRELLLLALGQVARESGTQLGMDLLLTPERRSAISRICLLDPALLDRRLDQMMPSFPRLISHGTRTGSYGRFIRLRALPTIEMLAEQARTR